MQAEGDNGNLPITNTLFPPPPDYYTAYTSENVAEWDSRRDEALSGGSAEAGPSRLDKPREDWVREEGRWMCFGQMYTTEPCIPTAAGIGLPPMIDPEEPPQTSLPPLLHSFLHTFLLLLEALTNTARIPGELESRGWAHEGDQYIQHMTNLSATMMVSVNQLRSVQAEATLVMLMEAQLAERRAQTAQMRSRCEAIATRLRALKTANAPAV